MPLGQLYTPEIETYAYGKDEGKASVEYIMSNPWFLNSIFGTATSAVSTGTLYSHTWSSNPSVDSTIRDINSMSLRVGFGVTTDFTNNPVGVICPSLTLRMSLNEPIKVLQELVWGETSVNETFAEPTGMELGGAIPYTFVHAAITSPVTGNTLATVQSFDLNMNTNAELIYGLNDKNAVDAYRKILEFTGKIGITLENSEFLSEVISREQAPNDLVVTISNGLTGNDERSVTLTFEGISFSINNVSGIEPGQLVIENADFQCRRCTAVAKNQETDVP